MSVRPGTLTLLRSGRAEVYTQPSTDIRITATMAQRRVSRLVISEIGNLLYGGEPWLVTDGCLCWRVPVLLAYPDTGPVGQVGTLDVDVETGEVLVTQKQLAEITNHAHYLAQRTPSAAE